MSDPSKTRIIGATKIPYKVEAVEKVYKDWAQKYETDMVDNGGYLGPEKLTEYIIGQPIDKHDKIIDLLGGTGILSKLLSKHGFDNMDILDASAEMLQESKSLGLYKNYIQAYIGKGHSIPVPANTYDHAVLCGGFVPGHACSDIFPEVTRIIKPGGFFMWAMRDLYKKEDEALSHFKQDVENMCASGKWKRISEISIDQYLLGSSGTVNAVQILE